MSGRRPLAAGWADASEVYKKVPTQEDGSSQQRDEHDHTHELREEDERREEGPHRPESNVEAVRDRARVKDAVKGHGPRRMEGNDEFMSAESTSHRSLCTWIFDD